MGTFRYPVTLYVNTEFDNEVTLDSTMNGDVDNFGNMTWRQLILECIGETLPDDPEELDQWFEENDEYGITATQLDEDLDSEAINKFYSELSYHQDNYSGSNVEAFNLIRSLQLFPMDQDGNGSDHGVTLVQSTANGPRKSVYIDDQDSADWLVVQANKRGVLIEVEFV